MCLVYMVENGYVMILMKVSINPWCYPYIIHFQRVFHYKPSILGYPHLGNLPIRLNTSFCTAWFNQFISYLFPREAPQQPNNINTG